MELTTRTTYFANTGTENTLQAFQLARDRAEELGIHKIIVATSSGATGALAVEFFTGFEVIVVSHAAGFREPNTQELTDENRSKIEARGAKIHTATHVLGGINRAIRRKFDTYQVDEIIAATLRLIGQGFKVACETALMAADAGLARCDEPVISIAGTNSGADTAVVLIPANSQSFFDLRVLEIICQPAPGHPGFA